MGICHLYLLFFSTNHFDFDLLVSKRKKKNSQRVRDWRLMISIFTVLLLQHWSMKIYMCKQFRYITAIQGITILLCVSSSSLSHNPSYSTVKIEMNLLWRNGVYIVAAVAPFVRTVTAVYICGNMVSILKVVRKLLIKLIKTHHLSLISHRFRQSNILSIPSRYLLIMMYKGTNRMLMPWTVIYRYVIN